jgi:YedE family putative selenium metabolism protein
LIPVAVLLFFVFVTPSFIKTVIPPCGRPTPAYMGIIAGVIIGILGQRSKFCFMAGFRNVFLMRDTSVLSGGVALFAAALIANLALGQTHFGQRLVGSPDYLWNFMGLFVVGIGAAFLGGCPFRQLVRASQGNSGAAISVFGMFIGTALAHNIHIAGMGRGPILPGKIAGIGSIALLLLLGILRKEKTP